MTHPVGRLAWRCFVLLCSLLLSGEALQAGIVELVSRASAECDTATGSPLFSDRRDTSLSADGRYVAFATTAVNLVPNQIDRNLGRDVFLHDRVANTTVLVSHTVGSNNVAGNYGTSYAPSISADGRWVAFVSTSDDLVTGTDTESSEDVFLYDRTTNTNIKVSVSGDSQLLRGSNSPVISADGSWVAFASRAPDLVAGQTDSNGTYDIFLYEVASGTRTLVSRAAGTTATAANSLSDFPSVSADGRYVAFESLATNLVAGQSDAVSRDVFLFDRVGGTTALVSRSAAAALTTAGGLQPAVSADGAYVAFFTRGTNLVAGQTDANSGGADLFLWERATGAMTLVSRSSAAATTTGNQGAGDSFPPSLSADGRWVAFPSHATDSVAGQVDANGAADVFLFDRTTSTTVLVSHENGSTITAANAFSGGPSLSADGRYLVFTSDGTDLVAGQSDASGGEDIFLFDRTTGTNRLLSGAGGSATTAGNRRSRIGIVSADGSRAAFWTSSDNIAAGVADRNQNEDLFVHDIAAGTNALVTLRAAGMISVTPGGSSSMPSVSADTRYVAFVSTSTNLVPGQTDLNVIGSDVFLTDRLAPVPATVLVSRSAGSATTTGSAGSGWAVISADGNYVVFMSSATNLVPGQVDTNFGNDVFLFDRTAGTTTLVSHAAGSATTAGNLPCFTSDLPGVSADGRWVAFACEATDLISPSTDANGGNDIFLFDRMTGQNVLLSHAAGAATTAGNVHSSYPVISADGSRVAFSTSASNLLSGSDTNDSWDVFLYDRASGMLTLVSRSSSSATTTGNDGSLKPDISADGTIVAFSSQATNLVPGQVDAANTDDLFVYDTVAGTMALATHHSSSVSLSPGGGLWYVFDLSADGRYVAFASQGVGFVAGLVDDHPSFPFGTFDVFVYDRLTQATDIVSAAGQLPLYTANEDSVGPHISAGGRFVAFISWASDLLEPNPSIDNPPHVYLRDRGRKTTELVSRDFNFPDDPGDKPSPVSPIGASSDGIAISSDGALVAFDSLASNLTPADYNATSDVFVYHWAAPPGTDLYTVAPCRVVDTRQDAPLASNVTYNLTIAGNCEIPASAWAIVANVTIVQPTGQGHMIFFPDGLPPSSSTINFSAGQTRANNAILELSVDGHLKVQPVVTGSGQVHLVLDVSGYYQ